MSGRFLDKSSYSRTTLNTYEVLAAYYIDIYYNHLYIEAKNLRTKGHSQNVAEGYKHALTGYLQSFDNPKLYKKTMINLHTYFINTGIISSIGFSMYTDQVSKEFIPQDYFPCLSSQQKMTILRTVLTQANKKFIETLVKSHMKNIIDNHNDIDNIRVLQDIFVEYLMIERESIYQRFITSRTKTNVKSPHINNQLLEKMQKEIKLLHNEKLEKGKQILKLKQIIIKKDNEVKDLKNKVQELTNNNIELKAQTNILHSNNTKNNFNNEVQSTIINSENDELLININKKNNNPSVITNNSNFIDNGSDYYDDDNNDNNDDNNADDDNNDGSDTGDDGSDDGSGDGSGDGSEINNSFMNWDNIDISF